MTSAVVLWAGDLLQGVVEGQAENLDVEVNGVAGQKAIIPAFVSNPAGIYACSVHCFPASCANRSQRKWVLSMKAEDLKPNKILRGPNHV